jgi:phosphoglucomutase
LEEQGYDVLFGYEEAIGFMFGTQIRDKDGVAATVSYFTSVTGTNDSVCFQVVFAELVASLCAQGKTVNAYLQELYEW